MILYIILYTILISFAAIFKSASDNMADHYDKSIFTRFNNPMFWDKSVSWQRKYNKGWQYWDPISDAWHISNGCMICSFIAAGIFFPTFNLIFNPVFTSIIIFIVSGVLFTLVFNTFYNHIFKKKS